MASNQGNLVRTFDSIPNDEDEAILQEALALIDSWDVSRSDDHNAGDGCTIKWPPRSLDEDARQHRAKHTKQARKPRARRPGTSSTAFQRRQKAQLKALHEEAVVLETRLANMNARTDRLWGRMAATLVNSNTQGAQSEASTWCAQAITQYRLRLESETRNRKLKTILSKQIYINDEIRSILHKHRAVSGMDVVLGNQSAKKKESTFVQ